MSETKARFRIQKGDINIEYEGEPKEVDSRFGELFEWVKTTNIPSKENMKNESHKKETQQKESIIEPKEQEKVDKRGGARVIKYSSTINELIKNGFFKLPNRKTVEDVLEEFRNKGLPYTGEARHAIFVSLKSKLKKGPLKGVKQGDAWSFWTEV